MGGGWAVVRHGGSIPYDILLTKQPCFWKETLWGRNRSIFYELTSPSNQTDLTKVSWDIIRYVRSSLAGSRPLRTRAWPYARSVDVEALQDYWQGNTHIYIQSIVLLLNNYTHLPPRPPPPPPPLRTPHNALSLPHPDHLPRQALAAVFGILHHWTLQLHPLCTTAIGTSKVTRRRGRVND